MRLSDEEIDLELKSDSWTIKKRLALELKQARAEIDLIRKNRNGVSSFLDCSERLKIAVEALEFYSSGEHNIDADKERFSYKDYEIANVKGYTSLHSRFSSSCFTWRASLVCRR